MASFAREGENRKVGVMVLQHGTMLNEMLGWGDYLQRAILTNSPVTILKLIFDPWIRAAYCLMPFKDFLEKF